MCAMVPATPVVVTLPLTDRSAPTVILPLPDPEVVTGGDSWLPLRATSTALPPPPPPLSCMLAQPARRIAITPTPAHTDRPIMRRHPCIDLPPSLLQVFPSTRTSAVEGTRWASPPA